jgi:tRNA A37 threonylcarbamoyladenosine biosynthesis protein TsaE
MTQKLNPIVKRVVDKFKTIQQIAEVFVVGNSAQRGLLISGDAGTGKSHYIKQAFIKTKTTKRVDYNKSKSFTAPAFYAKLWENRKKGDVVVFDDCSLESMSTGDFRKFTDFLKGGLELEKGIKMLGYEAATKNQLFKDLGVPNQFDFQGSIIWITNTRFDKLSKKFGDNWDAIQSRFIGVEVFLTKEEKYMYTMHLIDELDILGKNCEAKEGGYGLKIIEKTLNYLSDNYNDFKEITPRVAIKVADTMSEYPDMWEIILDNQNVYDYE